MNSKQRFLAALENQQPDRVPIMDVIDASIVLAIANILGFDTDRQENDRLATVDRYCLLVKELGLDATVSGFSIGEERVSDDLVRNRHGMVFRDSEHGESVIVEGPIKEPSDLQRYDMPKPRPDDFEKVSYTMERVGGDRAHFVGLGDPFKTSWELRGGMQYLLMDYCLNPGLVHDLARIATDFSLAAIELAAQVGVDGVFMGGDLASNQTTLMSPKHYREYVKPYHKELVDSAHQRGLKFIKHTDGNVWSILDDFVEVGFDAFHPVQPQSMDIVEVKGHLSGEMCVIGNIDCVDLLPSGSEEQVEESVRETIGAAAAGGGYILCSSNSIHPGVSPRNFIAMVRAGHRYGAY